MAENYEAPQGRQVTPHITLGADGKYRWIYELNLITNPTFFFMVWKIFFFILLGIAIFSTIVDAIEWSASFPERLWENLRFWSVFLIGMTVLTVVGYLIYAAMMGGKYCVLFEMDEKGVNHKQLPKQAKKAKTISELTVLGGLLTGNLTTVGVGMNSSRTQMYSDFAAVRKVKAYPGRKLIKVNGLLSHNQVYAEKEDFDFVLGFIRSHCPQIENQRP